MAIGPVQLIVLGFTQPDFHGEIVAELDRLRATDTIAVIDALAVHKDAAGAIEVVHLSTISDEEAIEIGSTVAALVGLGIAGETLTDDEAADAVELAASALDETFSGETPWDVLAEIPDDSAAALVLIEHRWAIGLRDAIARAGGFRISDGFISPLDLVAVGLLAAEEAKLLHALDSPVA